MVNIIIHQSGIKTYRRCHKAWHYKYVENLEKKKKGSALLRGTCCHEMIEAKANGLDPWEIYDNFIKQNKNIFEEEEELYGNLEEMISNIMEGYFLYYKNDNLKPVSINGKFAEHKFSVPLIENIILEGFIDMIVEDEKGNYWLMDHKTHKTLPQGDIAYSNIQSALYVWAWGKMVELGLWDLPLPRGVVWNYIRWKDPSKPKLLKDGSMSKNSNIDTTWRIYRKALIEAGLNPEDYKDMEQILDGRDNEFYVRHYLPLNQKIISSILSDTISTALQIKRAPTLDDRNITRDCSWCEFYPLCQAELKGLDSDLIRKCEYQTRVSEEEEKEND